MTDADKEARRLAAAERRADRLSKGSHWTPAPRPASPIGQTGEMNVDMIMADAHRMLRENTGTWTSYAELCEAHGLSRQLALVLARAIIPGGNTPEIYFRLRNADGVYNPGNHERSTANVEADGRLREIGVDVVGGRADPHRQMIWSDHAAG